MDIFSLLIVIAVFLSLFYIATLKFFTPRTMSAIFLGVTVFLGMVGIMPILLLWPALLLFSSIALLVFSPALQQKLIWNRLFAYLKNTIPSISRTEQVAADAGGVWWEQELFSGAPDWNKLFGLPEYEFSPAENSFLENELAQLCALIDRQAIDDSQGLPDGVWKFLKSKRFFGLVAPEAYGGLGFSHRMHAEVVGRIAVCSSAVAVSVMVPNSLGPGELIVKYGTEEQRKHYLPRLSAGKDIPCFGLTSLHAGSDAGGIEDTGVICRGRWHNKDVTGLRLNWSKRYITLAPMATLIGLAVKVRDPNGLLPADHHLHGQNELGITCVLVEAGATGVRAGRRHNPMNVYFQNGPIEGTDVFVPLDNIIGGAEMIGEGWRMLMECLSVGRCISLPALSVSACQMALTSTSAYSYSRAQFGRAIAKFDAVAAQNAVIALNALTTRASASLATDVLDSGKTSAVMSAMVKHYCTESFRDSVNRAMDVHAGRAVMTGSRNYLDELYRSIPVAITVEGANLLLRNLMIFGQGMLRCHPYLRREIDLISTKEAFDAEISIAFEAHTAHALRNLLRAVSYSWSAGLLNPTVSEQAPRVPQRQISTLCAQMATLVELCLLVYGGKLKRRELVSGHFAQAWTDLYCASAVLRARQSHGDEQRISQVCSLSIQRSLHSAQENLLAVISSLPLNRVARALVRWTIFPAWSRVKPMAENDLLEVNQALADPEGLRHILGGRVFDVLDYDVDSHPLNVVEKAMFAYSQLEKLRDRLPEHLASQPLTSKPPEDPAAVEVLGADGVKQWRECAAIVSEAMKVDDFDKSLN
ncbi:MAG: acyl-CoA dehydrogenase [Gammaproteobacteria bacterium]|nr:acyl-CoA dehydrogenase [Gammaproteobacteria bacterium]